MVAPSTAPGRSGRAPQFSVRLARLLSSVLLVSTAVACDDSTTSPRYDDGPAKIQLSASTLDLDRGDTTRISAVVLNRSGSPIASPSAGLPRHQSPVKWTSSDPSIANISRSGLILANRSGAVTLQASAGSLTSSASLSVDSKGKSITISPKVDTLHAIGHTLGLSVTVLNGSGKEQTNPSVSWTTLDPSVAKVDGEGLVTALAAGAALIVAAAQGQADTAQVIVSPADSPPPVVTVVEVSPETESAKVGGSKQFQATVKDGSGQIMTDVTVIWSSSDQSVATVTSTGVVTARSPGSAKIRATVEDKSGSAVFLVEDSDSPSPPSGEWDRVVADTLVKGDVVVPDGQRWLIGRNVRVEGNVRTHNGTIALRPGSSLTFVGADPSKYVGGGMHFTAGLHDNDFGIWIGAGHGARGMLDIQCTPKTGWNRTGVDPTWKPSDEYYIAPTAAGDAWPRSWKPGDAIPRPFASAPAAEVFNVTRDCVIEGPGHIHIHSSVPQRIEHVQLRGLGIIIPGMEDSGRYALHIHMMGDGSRGTVVRGVAAVNSRGRVYVPHSSHGISFFDNISVMSWQEAFWWDLGHRTNDILVDGFAVTGVELPRSVSGRVSREDAVVLGVGSGLVMRNAVVSGVRGTVMAIGYHWPLEVSSGGTPEWVLEDVIAHNISGAGLRFWVGAEATEKHEVKGYLSYHSGFGAGGDHNRAGIINSGYRWSNLYIENATLLGRPAVQRSGHSRVGEGRPQSWINLTVENPNGPAIWIQRNGGFSRTFTEYANCKLTGSPKVWVDVRPLADGRGGTAHRMRFRDCGIRPEDIVFYEPIHEDIVGSQYEIWENGRHRWTVSIDTSRRKVVTSF